MIVITNSKTFSSLWTEIPQSSAPSPLPAGPGKHWSTSLYGLVYSRHSAWMESYSCGLCYLLSCHRTFSRFLHVHICISFLFTPESPFSRYSTVCFSTPQWWTSGLLCFLAVTHKTAISLSPSLCEQMFPLLLGLSGEWDCWVRKELYV